MRSPARYEEALAIAAIEFYIVCIAYAALV